VQNAFDLDFSDGTPVHGRQQNATQRITQRMAKAAFQWLHHDTRVIATDGLDINDTWLQEFVYITLHA
jgi:hypothetical protein